MKPTKKETEQWLMKHGACRFDFKTHNVCISDGGLGCIEKHEVMRKKFLRFKKFSNGNSQAIFSEKKYKDFNYEYLIWFEEINETINYFKEVKTFLNKHGYKTSIGAK